MKALKTLGGLLGAALVGLLVVPLIALVTSTSLGDLSAGLGDASFAPALWLSVRTTLLSLAIIIVTGTPLAWWLASATPGSGTVTPFRARLSRVVSLLVELPIVIPPAVLGVALLQAFGRRGLFGTSIAFTEGAVVVAQIVVAAPFFVQATTHAFREVEPDMLIVARTLGASPISAFFRVALPIAWPGFVAGASLAWARALGEFGATLLFAGNMPGETQTMPLAIYTALESDVRVAVVLSLVLVAAGALMLVGLRVVLRRPS